jgi:hypothetical protein
MQQGPWLNCALLTGCTVSSIGMDMPSIPSQHCIELAVPSIAIVRVHCIDAQTCGASRSSVSRTETDWSTRFIDIVICIVAEAGFLVNCALSLRGGGEDAPLSCYQEPSRDGRVILY